jgi:hypothetical protein
MTSCDVEMVSDRPFEKEKEKATALPSCWCCTAKRMRVKQDLKIGALLRGTSSKTGFLRRHQLTI